jgi:hypothetical protein
VPDAVSEEARRVFDEKEVGQLIWAAAVINTWNRPSQHAQYRAPTSRASTSRSTLVLTHEPLPAMVRKTYCRMPPLR